MFMLDRVFTTNLMKRFDVKCKSMYTIIFTSPCFFFYMIIKVYFYILELLTTVTVTKVLVNNPFGLILV